MERSARKDVVFGAGRVYTVAVPWPKWKLWLDAGQSRLLGKQPHASPGGEPSSRQTDLTEPQPPPSDDFMADIQAYSEAKAEEVKRTLEGHEKELEGKYGADLELKGRLADFARQHRLDDGLIALWEEVQHYPGWKKDENFAQWNKLGVTDCEGSEKHEDRGDSKRVAFNLSGIRYEVVQTNRFLFDGSMHTDFALSENGMLVFGINTGVGNNDNEVETTYSCFDVFAMKKSGTWAKMLLDVLAMHEIESGKSAARLTHRYFGADQIKGNFQE